MPPKKKKGKEKKCLKFEKTSQYGNNIFSIMENDF